MVLTVASASFPVECLGRIRAAPAPLHSCRARGQAAPSRVPHGTGHSFVARFAGDARRARERRHPTPITTPDASSPSGVPTPLPRAAGFRAPADRFGLRFPFGGSLLVVARTRCGFVHSLSHRRSSTTYAGARAHPSAMAVHQALAPARGAAGLPQALLTHSCTAALEMAAILAGIGRAMKSSCRRSPRVDGECVRPARRRAGVVDIRPTPDHRRVEDRGRHHAEDPRDLVVHYAGVACEMEAIQSLARRHGLLLIADAAQRSARGIAAARSAASPLARSLSRDKNLISAKRRAPRQCAGARGAAEIVARESTNRGAYFRGEVDKYTWVEIGSSFLPSDIIAAFLWAQLEQAEAILARRQALWAKYHAAFEPLEQAGRLRRPSVPRDVAPNAHSYFLLLADLASRQRFIDTLRTQGVHAVFHYVPLHSSPAGRSSGAPAAR